MTNLTITTLFLSFAILSLSIFIRAESREETPKLEVEKGNLTLTFNIDVNESVAICAANMTQYNYDPNQHSIFRHKNNRSVLKDIIDYVVQLFGGEKYWVCQIPSHITNTVSLRDFIKYWHEVPPVFEFNYNSRDSYNISLKQLIEYWTPIDLDGRALMFSERGNFSLDSSLETVQFYFCGSRWPGLDVIEDKINHFKSRDLTFIPHF